MNCQTCKELLVSYMEELLDESQAHEVAEHVKHCPSCQAELKGLQTLQGRLVKNGQAAAQRDLEEQVMNRIIREQKVRLKAATEATAGLRLRRLIMKSPMTRIAVAAVVVVACLLGASMFRQTGSIALADVVAKVEQMRAYLYKATSTVEGDAGVESTSETTVLMSNDFGMKTDRMGLDGPDRLETRLESYLLPQDKRIILVDFTQKQYTRLSLDDETVANMKVENHDPREMIKRLLGCRYKELGTSVIEGIRVEGFETTDPNYLGNPVGDVSARWWVATETWLPVRYELEMDLASGRRLSMVQDGYQWGIPVQASDFEPDIPADFTTSELDGVQMPSYSEQGMIDALKLATDLTGRYPTALDADAIQQIMKDIATSETPSAQKLRHEWRAAGSPQAAATASQKSLMKMGVLAAFPRILTAQGAEPVYHGDVVTPSDAELPLMRWNVADGEYRVIFGDLHIETVTAKALTELEAALPK